MQPPPPPRAAQVLVFVNTVDEGVKLRLFLEAFGVRPALLNAELPLNSRSHILATFNRGVYDFLIATDDVHAAVGRCGVLLSKHAPMSGRKLQKAAGTVSPSKMEAMLQPASCLLFSWPPHAASCLVFPPAVA